MKRVMNCKGFTLAELVVVMGIFIIIMIISTYAFENILTRSGQQGKSAESDISGMVGLEIMRADIASAGYGLPWGYQNLITYDAAKYEITGGNLPATGVLDTGLFDALKDLPTSVTAVPRAIVGATCGSTSPTNSGIDYLVVKAAILGVNRSARRWNFVNFSTNYASGANKSYLLTRGDSTDIAPGDRAITLESKYATDGTQTKQLLVNSSGVYQYTVPAIAPPSPGPVPTLDDFKPADSSHILVAYGIKDADLLMPYNRVDFYVDKAAYVNNPAAKPAACSTGTGVLTKAVADHAGGWGLKYPLLDCVGDMKIIYELDPNNNGSIMLSSSAGEGAMTAAAIRTQLQNVRVYILAHEGKRDPGFTYPVTNAASVICVGPNNPDGTCNTTLGTSWSQTALQNTFGAKWQNYRWKVYYFVVNLKNLQ